MKKVQNPLLFQSISHDVSESIEKYQEIRGGEVEATFLLSFDLSTMKYKR